MSIRRFSLAYHPKRIKLGSNGKILPDKEIERIKALMIIEGKYSRKTLQSEYPAIYAGGQYFILCTGDDHGEGGYGKIIPAQNADTGEFVAFKLMLQHLPGQDVKDKNKQNDGAALSSSNWLMKCVTAENSLTNYAIAHEIEFLKDVGLAIVDEQGEPIKLSYLSRKKPEIRKCMFAMKWLPGDTVSGCRLNKMPLLVLLEVIEKMLLEVKRCHQLGILHRDLKGDNFIFDFAANTVKLIDFGLARYMNDQHVFHDSWPAGCDDYIAPELYNIFDTRFIDNFTQKQIKNLIIKIKDELLSMEAPTRALLREKLAVDYVYSEKTEIYALGKELMFMKNSNNENGAHTEILQRFIALYQQMMDLDPVNRPTLAACIQFFHDLKNQLNKNDKVIRIGIYDILEVKTLLNGNDRYIAFCTMEDFHWIVFFHRDLQPAESLYNDVIDELTECGITQISRDVYLTPLNNQFLLELQNELLVKNPQYQHKFYYAQPDSTVEIKPDDQKTLASLSTRLGVFAPEKIIPADSRDFIDDNIYPELECCIS